MTPASRQTAASIVERIAPPHLREAAFLRAVVAIREGRDAEQAVREYVQRQT
jgi:hypothetical protein